MVSYDDVPLGTAHLRFFSVGFLLHSANQFIIPNQSEMASR